MTDFKIALALALVGETESDREAAKNDLRQMLQAESKLPQIQLQNPINEADVEPMIHKFLTEIGVPCHILGHRYLVCAIHLAVKDHTYVEQITKKLYKDAAKLCDTTPSKLERALRHAIELAWDRCDIDVLQHYFGNTISNTKGKPTNSEFIAMAEYIIRDQMKEAT